LSVITGSAAEKLEVFKQLAGVVSANMFPTGYDTPAKVIAASWRADALGVHPIVYMDGVQPIQFQSGERTVRLFEPKKDFIVGLLRARLPGFRMEVKEETNERCTITMYSKDDQQTVTYTIEDAERQGLVARNKDVWTKNRKEMIFKQTVKRCGFRIGAHVLMGMGAAEDEPELMPDMDGPVAPALAAAPAPKPIVIDWRASFAKAAKKSHGIGVKNAAKLLTLARLIEKERTGAEPTWKKASEVTPADAEMLWRELNRRYPEKVNEHTIVAVGDKVEDAGDESDTQDSGSKEGAPAQTENAVASVVEEQMDRMPIAADKLGPEDEPPPVDEAPVPQIGWTELMLQVTRVRKAFGSSDGKPLRPIVKEAPEGTKKYWLVDSELLDVVYGNHTVGRKLMADGQVCVSDAILKVLHDKLQDMATEREAKRT
jgi:hypothetical protein